MKALIVFLISLTFFACKSPDLAKRVPRCINAKITSAQNSPVQNPPLEVWEWKDEANTYYYFTASCCDQFSTLYNEKCNLVCAPDGGFTGKGDGKCPEFKGELQKTLIWKDAR